MINGPAVAVHLRLEVIVQQVAAGGLGQHIRTGIRQQLQHRTTSDLPIQVEVQCHAQRRIQRIPVAGTRTWSIARVGGGRQLLRSTVAVRNR